ncbi:MAG: FHA domain-containing protein [Gammaproteobacteria bacterium]|nr:FHA domain-containing protein [Gammaproteobacteria bacterium]
MKKSTKFRHLLACRFPTCLLLLAFHGSSSAIPDVDRIESSIVRVVIGGHGTGWVVSPGVVATNWHVTDGNTSFEIYPAGTDREYRGELIWQGNSDRDIGLISVPDLDLTPFKLRTGDAIRGSDSYTVGFPGLGDDLTGRANLNVSVYGGTIALVTENVAGVRIIQHTNIVNAGNSGGPLLDDCGRVLGLTTWGVENEQYSADFIWASVHVAELANQLDTLGIPYETDNTPCATGGVSAAGEEALVELGFLQDQLQDQIGDQEGAMKSLEQLVRNWGIALGALLALTLALALRKPRQQLVRVYDEMSRRIGAPGKVANASGSLKSKSVSGSQNSTTGIVLSGFTNASNAFRFEFGMESLTQVKGLSVGRSNELADFVLADEQISRRHLRISLKDKKIHIEDLNSSNGTYVNGQLIAAFRPRVLNVGDRVKVGTTEIAVSTA